MKFILLLTLIAIAVVCPTIWASPADPVEAVSEQTSHLDSDLQTVNEEHTVQDTDASADTPAEARLIATHTCLTKCKPGFRPSPLKLQCVSTKACGPNFISSALFCRKRTHTRGAGLPLRLTCRAHEELQGLLCYRKCKSGYNLYDKGHGATCFKSVLRWHFKKTYGRGADRAADRGCQSG